VTHSLCETGLYPVAVYHIRVLSDAGPRYGDGADTPSLCGTDVRWDIHDLEFTPEILEQVHDRICSRRLNAYEGRND